MKPEHFKKVGLFGGTFDPVHEGHVAIAEASYMQLDLDCVVFLPCRQSPLKENATSASGEERVEMLRLATRDRSWAKVDDWEVQQKAENYSWKTAEEFQRRFPQGQLFWIMGEDQWATIELWNRAEYFQSLVQVVVHGRGGFESRGLLPPHPMMIAGDHPASATELRRKVAAGEPLPERWLHPEVAEFIKSRGLYLG